MVYLCLYTGMAKKPAEQSASEMLQGTLDMLILQTLLPGPARGHTIAHVIEKRRKTFFR